MKYCILSINTRRRQDLLVSLVYSIFWPEKDRVLVECALPDKWGLKGLLYVLKSTQVRSLINEYQDFKDMCKKYTIQGLTNSKISVFGEHNDTISYVFDKRVIEVLNKHGKILESLELSDCYNNVLHSGNTIKMKISLGRCKTKDY